MGPSERSLCLRPTTTPNAVPHHDVVRVLAHDPQEPQPRRDLFAIEAQAEISLGAVVREELLDPLEHSLPRVRDVELRLRRGHPGEQTALHRLDAPLLERL